MVILNPRNQQNQIPRSRSVSNQSNNSTVFSISEPDSRPPILEPIPNEEQGGSGIVIDYGGEHHPGIVIEDEDSAVRGTSKPGNSKNMFGWLSSCDPCGPDKKTGTGVGGSGEVVSVNTANGIDMGTKGSGKKGNSKGSGKRGTSDATGGKSAVQVLAAAAADDDDVERQSEPYDEESFSIFNPNNRPEGNGTTKHDVLTSSVQFSDKTDVKAFDVRERDDQPSIISMQSRDNWEIVSQPIVIDGGSSGSSSSSGGYDALDVKNARLQQEKSSKKFKNQPSSHESQLVRQPRNPSDHLHGVQGQFVNQRRNRLADHHWFEALLKELWPSIVGGQCESLAVTYPGIRDEIEEAFGDLASHTPTSLGPEMFNQIFTDIWPALRIIITHVIDTEIVPVVRAKMPFRAQSINIIADLGECTPRFDHMTTMTRLDKFTGARSLELEIGFRMELDDTSEFALELFGYGIGIKNLSFTGDMHVVFHNFQKADVPIAGVAIYFVRPPEISFEFEGGVTGVFDLFAVGPTLESVIRDVLGNAMVLPNRIAIPVDPTYSMINVSTPTPEAVLRLQIVSGRNLPGADWNLSSWFTGNMTSDPYVVVRLGASKRSTSIVKRNCNPDWKDVNLFHMQVDLPMEQILELDVYDYDLGKGDDKLAYIRLAISELLQYTGESAHGRPLFDHLQRREGNALWEPLIATGQLSNGWEERWVDLELIDSAEVVHTRNSAMNVHGLRSDFMPDHTLEKKLHHERKSISMKEERERKRESLMAEVDAEALKLSLHEKLSRSTAKIRRSIGGATMGLFGGGGGSAGSDNPNTGGDFYEAVLQNTDRNKNSRSSNAKIKKNRGSGLTGSTGSLGSAVSSKAELDDSDKLSFASAVEADETQLPSSNQPSQQPQSQSLEVPEIPPPTPQLLVRFCYFPVGVGSPGTPFIKSRQHGNTRVRNVPNLLHIGVEQCQNIREAKLVAIRVICTPCLSSVGEPLKTAVVGESSMTFMASAPQPKLENSPERIAKLKKNIQKLRARWMPFDEIAQILEISEEMAINIDNGTLEKVTGDYINNKAFSFLLTSAREAKVRIEVVDKTDANKDKIIGIYNYDVIRLMRQPRYSEMVKDAPLEFCPETTITMQCKLRVLSATGTSAGVQHVAGGMGGVSGIGGGMGMK